MNKTYRTVWNQARNCLMVVSENTRSQGKAHGSGKVVVQAVTAALLALGNGAAFAGAGDCTSPATTTMANGSVTSYSTNPCETLIIDPGTSSGDIGINVNANITNNGVVNGGWNGLNVSGSPAGTVLNNNYIANTGGGNGISIWTGATLAGGVINNGTVSSPNLGVALHAGTLAGGLVNNSLGLIRGDWGPIQVQYGSSIVNGITNSGTLQGNIEGVVVRNSSSLLGGLTNTGSIVGNGWSGIFIAEAGTTISGGITNSGGSALISGGGNSGQGGITVTNGATITGGITNSGTIMGHGSGRAIWVSGNVSLDSLSIDGNNTAKFIGPVEAPNTPATVVAGATYTMDNGNQFTVSGFTTDGTVGVAAGGTGTITGNYIQNTNGVLRVNGASGAVGTLTISGTATMPANTVIQVVTGDPATCGGITTGTLSGVIASAGTMTGASTFTVTDDCSNVSFTAVQNGNAIDLVAVGPPPACTVVGADFVCTGITGGKTVPGSVSGTVTNSGTLTSSPGLLLNGGTLANGVTNSGSISGGGVGIELKSSSHVAGNINNSGTVSVNGSGGIRVWNSARVDGALTNSGAISAHTGIYISNFGSISGGINNSGAITAAANGSGFGLEFRGNSNPGSVYVASGFTNSGTISGFNTGIYFRNQATLTGGMVNTGKITADTIGIEIYNNSLVTGGISNSGTMQSTWWAGIDVWTSTVNGDIVNSATGSISSRTGINVVYNAHLLNGGNIINDGFLSGTGTGIWLSDGSSMSGGITNSGTIIGGGSGGINIYSSATIAGGITNSGTISGGGVGDAIYVGPTNVIVPSIVITGNNTAKFIGGVNAATTPTSVASGATYTMDNGQQFTVSGFTTDGTVGVAAGGTAWIAGNYAHNATGVLRVNATNSTTFGKLIVSGRATLTSSTLIDVATGNAATCGGITAGTTLAGVIVSGGVMSGASGYTVTDDCTNINFNAVQNGNAIDLIAAAPPPVTYTVTGASGGNGTVSCVSPVTSGGTATCTGTASGGYHLTSASGCGTATVSGNTITAGPVTAACTVTGTFTAATATRSNIATTASGVTATLAAVGCTTVDSAVFVASPPGAPANATFPYGLLDFTLSGCGPTASVTVTYSQNLPNGMVFYKEVGGRYSTYPANIGVNSVSFTLTDGGLGDSDGLVNGSIHDPSGLLLFGSAGAGTTAIPTLSEWGMLMLTGLMALLGLGRIRRRPTLG